MNRGGPSVRSCLSVGIQRRLRVSPFRFVMRCVPMSGVFFSGAYFGEFTQRTYSPIQGDHTGCVKPPVDNKIKVAF